MKTIRKNSMVIFSTLLLIFVVIFVTEKESTGSLQFQIERGATTQNITVFDGEDGNYYVFLPSYSSMEDVRMILPFGQTYSLNNVQLSNGMSCEIFELEQPYQLSVDDMEVAILWFYQSRNVATMYIDTVSGDMQKIHEDKNYEEFASMVLHLPDGSVNYVDKRCKLKGRGNSTWACDKPPYLLTLSDNGDLLDMGSAKKWVLLANAYDETNLNNKLIFDLASQVGFEWSPECQYVDLYLNGEYNGLYLLSEKIEVSSNRVDIDTASGEFLCKVDTPSRVDRLKYYLESSMGRIIEICSEGSLSTIGVDDISYLVYQMEKEIQSGNDLSESELLDLDSWVRRYLIDEISGNIDSDLTSSYFYYADGKYFAGPIWDYDMSLGNSLLNQEPNAFIAKNAMKRRERVSAYYRELIDNNSFYKRVVELYNSEYASILQDMINHGLDEQIKLIQAASKMNRIRWCDMYDEWRVISGEALVHSTEELKEYFIKRVQFLNKAWLEEIDYCTVQFEKSRHSPHWNISVEKGSVLETTYFDLINTVWVDYQTGEPVDFQKPITRDMIVIPQTTE